MAHLYLVPLPSHSWASVNVKITTISQEPEVPQYTPLGIRLSDSFRAADCHHDRQVQEGYNKVRQDYPSLATSSESWALEGRGGMWT